MSPVVVAALAVAGLFVGSAVWIIARNQAARRPLWSSPRCEETLGLSISASAVRTRSATANPEPVAEGAAIPSAPSAAAGCGDRLPTLAWLPLFGLGTVRRCPACGLAQSGWRVAFEATVAAYFALAAWRIDEWLPLAATLAFAVPLLIILLVDLWTRLIFTNIIYAGMALGLVFALAEGGAAELLWAALAMAAAAAVFGLFFLLAMVIYRNVRVVPFGSGDIYLAAMIGSMVRLNGLVNALFLGIVLAAAGGLLLLATRRAGRRQAMPYGPFLCLGALIALAW